ncbi:MAG: hypothetical protein IJV18_01520, partial [Acidaminococcaceae bacterium]|nr:hypothetical protein [Acidaminococcaceae bacterium]
KEPLINSSARLRNSCGSHMHLQPPWKGRLLYFLPFHIGGKIHQSALKCTGFEKSTPALNPLQA